jgi:uncharacterized protein DUF4410
MNHAKRDTAALLAALGALSMALLLGASARIEGRQLNSAPQNVTVYVRDFELSVASANVIAAMKPAPGTVNNRQTLSPTQQERALQAQAQTIKDLVANTLVDTLRKDGYVSARQQGKPEKGIVLDGVFAEADGKNRIRRALLGGGAQGTKYILYVGTFDQKSLNQPLYKEAPVQERDEQYGPLITLNAYIPLAKYEIDKDATEEDIQKICGQMARNLTTLLSRNPAAVAQSQ